MFRRVIATILVCVTWPVAASARDWTHWRGPEQNGVSREKGLPTQWSPEGENVLWTNSVGGMSSPIVMNGRVYTLTRVGDEILEFKRPEGDVIRTAVAGPRTQEAVVCIDADSGKVLWEHRMAMTQTEVPFHRLGWSNAIGDPSTGRVYALGAQCWLVCLDGKDGKVIWQRQLTEEFGVISTFGGRTPSPTIDEDQVLVGGVSFGWGDHARGQHRLFAFDKNTGELNWASATGGTPVDAPYNTPMIAVIGGQRLAILGAGDGGVHAFQVRTGKKVWSYPASKRGINASVVVDGTRVYVSHSEENVAGGPMGAISCIDVADGTPRELWRSEGLEVGFSTPTLAGGRLYAMDNAGSLHALDTADGRPLWKRRIGTIGKASLVWADGMLFVAEANGRFVIVKPGEKNAEIVSRVQLEEKAGREYVIFGSPAIANGRIYLQTANRMYCIGPKAPTVSENPLPERAKETGEAGPLAQIVVTPADVALRPGEKVSFRAAGFDALGRPVGAVKGRWSIAPLEVPSTQPSVPPARVGNLKGAVDAEGTYTAGGGGHQGGAVQVVAGDVRGMARVRVMPPLPWAFDFEDAPVDKPPLTWLGAGGKFWVTESDGSRVLNKIPQLDLYYRARTNFGLPSMSNYTLAADVRVGHKTVGGERHMPDAGIINSRYVLVLLGNHQRLQIHVWPAALPAEDNPIGALSKTIAWEWKPDTWYRMKLRVEQAADKAIVRGKVWPREAREPAEWAIELEDAMPNRSGNPGLFGHSLVATLKSEIHYDNITVTENE